MTPWLHGTCDAHDIRIHYLRTGGAKPPIVLLHGLTGDGACWTPLARALEAEFDVIMPDARGHGRSSAPLHGYQYDQLATDVVELLHALKLCRPILLGHSMGGMTAAVVASREGKLLRGLILVDPTFLSPERQREVHKSDVAASHRQTLRLPRTTIVAQAQAKHPHRPLELIELQAQAKLMTHQNAFDVLTPPNPEYHKVVSTIDVPSLLVFGDHTLVTHDMATELHHLNSQLQLKPLPDATHALPFDDPERLAEGILPFLRDPGGRAGRVGHSS